MFAPRSSSSPTPLSTAPAEGGRLRGPALAFFLLGVGSFLALYLPQPLLPDLDRQFHTPPSVTGLVMTAALLGFALAGLLREGDPQRTLRVAMWLTAGASLVAALSPHFAVLLVGRAGQGVGVGMLIAGALAEVPRRLPPVAAARVNGALIAGTALGGLGGRVAGYSGLFLTWRGAFLAGGAALLLLVGLSLRSLARLAGGRRAPRDAATRAGSAPFSLLAAGLFILFVNVAFFDLLPYRLSSPPFRLPESLGDLVYLVYLTGSVFGYLTGHAIARFGPRAVIIAIAFGGSASLLATLGDRLWLIVAGAAGCICATVGLHAAHSGWAAAYGRATVGRYLTIYYVGGAAGAPLCAYTYQLWGWPGVILPLVAAWLAVALLAVTRQQPDRAQGQEPDLDVAPSGPPG